MINNKKTSSTQTRTQKQRKESAENALIKATIELIAEQGIQNTSFVHIGERAGYSRGLVTHHFGSKEVLIETLVNRVQDYFVRFVQMDKTETGLQSLLNTSDRYIDILFKESKISRAYLILWTSSLYENEGGVSFQSADQRILRKITYVIDTGKQDGSIPDSVNSAEFAEIFLAFQRGLAMQILTKSISVKKAALKSQARAMILGGLRSA